VEQVLEPGLELGPELELGQGQVLELHKQPSTRSPVPLA